MSMILKYSSLIMLIVPHEATPLKKLLSIVEVTIDTIVLG